jgi:hypothetical protein
MPGFTAMGMALALEARSRLEKPLDDPIADLVEEGLTDAQLITEVRRAIAESSLSEAKKKQLQQGVTFLTAKEYEFAGPLLMRPLEGAFWAVAEERGLAHRDGHGTWIATAKSGKPGKHLRGVEAVFALPGLALDPLFRRFLVGLAYGGTGHPYRHGEADEGWRLRSLCFCAPRMRRSRRSVTSRTGRPPRTN